MAGGLNVFQFVGWIIAIGLIIAMIGVNLVGARLVSRGETAIVAFELLVVAAFVVVGLSKAHTMHLDAAGGDGILGILFGPGCCRSRMRASGP